MEESDRMGLETGGAAVRCLLSAICYPLSAYPFLNADCFIRGLYRDSSPAAQNDEWAEVSFST